MTSTKPAEKMDPPPDHGPNEGPNDDQGKGPNYFLIIEGEEFPWDHDTITTEQIARLGGWDVSQGVIEVDDHNNERTLPPGEVVQIKPGHGFGKKHKWKRG